eukprot:gnl/MRDRNA2_/MRDRNA2_109081_c0_seq1.p1 gnl/MRDRNA2_/MRDRNA2_109081_c0~~gnl/MRDRNA2_/MRDRNA2_109081_c0_seq1.p1  ORF type:complete len:1032 (+),score=228.37 gnl/MRDRNA2_/MRDRNA2_109081_c0_seq1:106-3201(+)
MSDAGLEFDDEFDAEAFDDDVAPLTPTPVVVTAPDRSTRTIFEDSFGSNDGRRTSLMPDGRPSLIDPQDPLRLEIGPDANINKPLTSKEREALESEFANLQAQIKKQQSKIESMRVDYQKEIGMLKRLAKKREDDAKRKKDQGEEDDDNEKKAFEADAATSIFYFSANMYCADGFDPAKASAEVEAMLRKGMQKWMAKQTEKVTNLQEALVTANVRQAQLDHLVSNAMGFLKVPNVEQFVDSILIQDEPRDLDKETGFAQTLKKLDERAAEAAIKIKDQIEGDCMGDAADAETLVDKLNSAVQATATQVNQRIEREEAQKRDKIRQELVEAEEKRDLFEWHAENLFNCLPDGALDEDESEADTPVANTKARKLKRSESSQGISLKALRTASKVQQQLPITLAESFFEVCSQIGPMSARAAFEARKKMLNPGKGRKNLGTRRSLDMSMFGGKRSSLLSGGEERKWRPRSNSIGSPMGVGRELMKMFKGMDMTDALAEAAAPFMMRRKTVSVQTDIKCKQLGPFGITSVKPRGISKRATLELDLSGWKKNSGGDSKGLKGLASAVMRGIRAQRLSDTEGIDAERANLRSNRQSLNAEEAKPLEARISLSSRWSLISQDLNNAVQAARTSGAGDTPLPPVQGKNRKGSVSIEEMNEGGPAKRTSIIGGGIPDHLVDEQDVAPGELTPRPMTSQSVTRTQDKTPMPVRPQSSFDANRMLLDEREEMEKQLLGTFALLPGMMTPDWKSDAVASHERSSFMETSKELSSGVVDGSLGTGVEHSQNVDWQAARDVQAVTVPWASWTDGRGKPSYTRCGGWLVSLKQAQRGNEKISGSNSGTPMLNSTRSVPVRANHPKQNASVDAGTSGHLSSTSPSAQLWQASIDHDVFLASENGTRINVDDFFQYHMEAEYSLSDEELAQLQAEVHNLQTVSRRGRTRTRRRDASRSRSRGHGSSGSHSQSRSRSASASPSRSASCPRSPSVEKCRGVIGACLEPRPRIWTPQHGFCQEDLQPLAETPEPHVDIALRGSDRRVSPL